MAQGSIFLLKFDFFLSWIFSPLRNFKCLPQEKFFSSFFASLFFYFSLFFSFFLPLFPFFLSFCSLFPLLFLMGLEFSSLSWFRGAKVRLYSPHTHQNKLLIIHAKPSRILNIIQRGRPIWKSCYFCKFFCVHPYSTNRCPPFLIISDYNSVKQSKKRIFTNGQFIM